MLQEPVHATLNAEEWQLLLALRDIPESPLRTKTLGLLRDLAFYLRQPRCGGLQSDGFPCGSPHTSCEDCQQVYAFLDDLSERLENGVKAP